MEMKLGISFVLKDGDVSNRNVKKNWVIIMRKTAETTDTCS